MASLVQLHRAFRPFAEALVSAARGAGLSPTVTSTKRSSVKQRQLYENWQRGRSPYPAAPPGTSLHEHGLAFDMTVRPMSALKACGEAWEALGKGFRWGGRFGDPIHFEYRPPP